jgi:hypothetical protein
MPFLPVFTTVATWFVLSIHASLLSACTRNITSPFLQNAYCPVFKCWLHILGQVECPLLVLIEPQTLAYLSNKISADLTLA